MALLTIRNDFHRTVARVQENAGLSRRRLRDIRRRLCPSPGCLCGGTIGERGPQDPGVADFIHDCQEFLVGDLGG